jgi:hypothetical protein
MGTMKPGEIWALVVTFTVALIGAVAAIFAAWYGGKNIEAQTEATAAITSSQAASAEAINRAQNENAKTIAEGQATSAGLIAKGEQQVKLLDIFSKQITSPTVSDRLFALSILQAVDLDLGQRLSSAIHQDTAQPPQVQKAAGVTASLLEKRQQLLAGISPVLQCKYLGAVAADLWGIRLSLLGQQNTNVSSVDYALMGGLKSSASREDGFLVEFRVYGCQTAQLTVHTVSGVERVPFNLCSDNAWAQCSSGKPKAWTPASLPTPSP